MQAHPEWQPRDVARAIRLSANNLATPDERTGYGIPYGPYALAFDPSIFVDPPSSLGLQLLNRNPIMGGSMRFRAGLPCADTLGTRGAALTIHDSQGRRVREVFTAGECQSFVEIEWDGKDDKGARVRPGIYFASLRSQGQKATVRVVCLR